jgi:DGQHR domain-containing protein
MSTVLALPALRIRQGSQFVYAFGIDGRQITRIASISRAHRDDGLLKGYQRPEVVSHIRAIRRYIESAGAMLPNAIVIAFDSTVVFIPDEEGTDFSIPGVLRIPLANDPDHRPGWLVDGQQRTAALRDASLDDFAAAAIAFIASEPEQQRSQFILVNNTKPLPKGLIHEMLPDTPGHLPPAYARRRLPATVMIRLHADADSPFLNRIAMPTSSMGNIKDTSVLRMIETSLYDGAMYQYRDPDTGDGDVESMVRHLKCFWTCVADTWPEAWKLEPRKSRLTHGAGIRSLGHIMDDWTEDTPVADLSPREISQRLASMSQQTSWTSGQWESSTGTRRWNSWQNTPSDIQELTRTLMGM